MLFARTFPANNILFAGTDPENNTYFGLTVLESYANTSQMSVLADRDHTSGFCHSELCASVPYNRETN